MEKMITNMLTIDVEDYFHVSAFEKVSPPSTWEFHTCRVEQNTDRILNMLYEEEIQATFFVLGWVAKRYPSLVKRIASAGHEVASHGYWHQRVCEQKRSEFREDIRSSKSLLEDLIGQQIVGYRAPSYSISPSTCWAFDELLEAGYRYDSSIFPIKHDLYGFCDWARFSTPNKKAIDGTWGPNIGGNAAWPNLMEIPITTLALYGKKVPISGGGYFRLYPYAFTEWGLKKINREDDEPFVFYLHPWEIDPAQPVMAGAGCKSRFRHYLNLSKTENRFRRLIKYFRFSSIVETIVLA